MAFRVPGECRSFIVLAIASVGLPACSSAPTAPSARSANEAGPEATTASAPAASAAAGGAQASAADTIKITRGTLALESGRTGSVTLRGSHGFRFEGDTRSGLEPSFYCGAFDPCEPGATVAFTARWVGFDLPGTVRMQGDEFTVGGADPSSMGLELTGSFVAPAHLTDTVSVTVPFTASGTLLRGYPYPTVSLSGDGVVTFTLEWQPFLGGWAITRSSFDFGNGPADRG